MIKQLLFITFATLSINAHGAAKYPLHNAVKNKDLHLVRQLLATKGTDVNKKNKFGHTPLHFAAQDYSFKIAELLIKHGADTNAKNNAGKTPLEIASVDIYDKLKAFIDSLSEIKEPDVK